MRLAFYKAAAGGALDHMIDKLSGGDGYSHVELVFSDGQFYTSSGMDGGCRFKQIEQDNKWTYFDVDLTPAQECAVRKQAQADANDHLAYDFWAILTFDARLALESTKITIPDNRKERFCSEECLICLATVGLFTNLTPVCTSPDMWQRWLRVNGYTPIEV